MVWEATDIICHIGVRNGIGDAQNWNLGRIVQGVGCRRSRVLSETITVSTDVLNQFVDLAETFRAGSSRRGGSGGGGSWERISGTVYCWKRCDML